MTLRVSIDGMQAVLANNVVIYRDDVPVAVACDLEGNVLYADGVRDPEFITLLQTLGISPTELPTRGPTIRGRIGS